MSLSQGQIIQSLGEALAWFEKELGWGVAPAELNHLAGRIGELYAAMVTRGQMAMTANQRGYDVVSASGDRISVKTVTTSTHVTFNANTPDQVDRVMVLRINVDETVAEIEELLDCPIDEASRHLRESRGKLLYYISRGVSAEALRDKVAVVAEATLGPHRVLKLENATILVETRGGQEVREVKGSDPLQSDRRNASKVLWGK